jgi:glycosyltransferase involved in cell wall biosynthesis
MDIVGDSISATLRQEHADTLQVSRVRPVWKSRAGVVGSARTLNRLANRMWDYPRFVRSIRSDFDLFHIVDHSYAHLVHELPAERTVVTCHDLDTFRCLLGPDRERRSPLFRAMTKRILSGFQKAARILCVSQATLDELMHYRLVPSERLQLIHNGIDPAFRPSIKTTHKDHLELLHVGRPVGRKRLDIVLHTFAAVLKRFPAARLSRVGGAMTGEQKSLADQLGIANYIDEQPFLSVEELAALYARAALVLSPSDAEGFCLPLAEAMACGTVPVVSDIPVLREIGSDVAVYCRPGDFDHWSTVVTSLLEERTHNNAAWIRRREAAIRRGASFRWQSNAEQTVRIYQELLV